MQYSEGIELAQEYAERALEIMKSNNIPATPRNFAIWYTYVNEKYPDLKKTLDVLISNKQIFTSQKNDEVYDKFFTNSDEGVALQETSQKIENQVGRVLEMMGDASGGVADFGKTLTESLGALTDSKGLAGIREAVQSLALETQKMQKSNSTLQSKLKESSQEIASLRKNLEDVQREAMTDALTGIANRKMFDTPAGDGGDGRWRAVVSRPGGYRLFQKIQRHIWTPDRGSGFETGCQYSARQCEGQGSRSAIWRGRIRADPAHNETV